MTARELLADVTEGRCAEHTVVKRTKAVKGSITFTCSCGIVCEVVATPENDRALALVPSEVS